jgi:hypothetical protein
MTQSNGKRTVGRPTVMTPEIINKLEQAFSIGCGDLEACIYADLTPSVLYRYQESHPEFKERKAMLKEKLILKSRSVIAYALDNKDENTAKWYLERKRKDEFSSKQEISGLMGVVNNKPDLEEIRKLKELLENGSNE